MAQITEILAQEHRWIERMLQALVRLAEIGERQGRIDAQTTPQLIALFEHFADGLHQRKEEEILFPRLVARANVRDKTFIARLMGDHEQERRAMKNLRSELLGGLVGDSVCVANFARGTGNYVDLHLRHMAREDNVLLPMAERLLTPEDDRDLIVDVGRLEEGAPAGVRRPGELVAAICARLGIAGPADVTGND